MNDTIPPAPVTPKEAASLLVIRQGPAGTEALMGMRGAKHQFMPNRLVFPGGKVDSGDFTARIASPLRPDVLMRLEKASNPTLALALAHAAARELEEETGLSLGLPPHLDGFDYLCRAITPAPSPMRFDARFLIVDADRVTGELAGSGELENLKYWGVADALELDLAFPTRKVLEQLLEYLELTDAERRNRSRTPVLFNRAWELE